MTKETKNKNILVIDDEPEGLDLILTSFGYNIDIATNGKEGLNKLFADNSYDLVIIDLVLPYMSGWKILENIRNHNKIKTIPVIILTAFNTSENHISSLNIGADDYVSKPYEISTLLARIESLLRRVNWHDRPKIDLPLGENGTDINLTRRQVEILSLMSQGYSNKQMAERLFLSETTIKAHLRSIFKKLEVANRTQAVLVGINKGLLS